MYNNVNSRPAPHLLLGRPQATRQGEVQSGVEMLVLKNMACGASIRAATRTRASAKGEGTASKIWLGCAKSMAWACVEYGVCTSGLFIANAWKHGLGVCRRCFGRALGICRRRHVPARLPDGPPSKVPRERSPIKGHQRSPIKGHQRSPIKGPPSKVIKGPPSKVAHHLSQPVKSLPVSQVNGVSCGGGGGAGGEAGRRRNGAAAGGRAAGYERKGG